MTNGNGVFGPIARALRAAGDETEIDEADLCPREMCDQVAPNSGMKAPAMDEDKVHQPRSAERAAR
jgi:hypothetical protein